ncbi:3'-5' exonuclease [Roseicella sp. DB1501]|uniref:3'-5' exonuclease n=1 Tax=Roseicella sp. DB1501 TaxID=2730925 RepID=UPI0014928610|nr:3'-5' exonuclease [Roseicella sp. DB1501]NOG71280.1 UvrD-helicase domain-containing protein [Roseicella sp. DB1501]
MTEFRIADTFTSSLARLTAQEQKAVKTTAFDLQMDPSSPGLSFHKLDRAQDKNFWSVRVNADIRLIVHRTPSSLLLVHVDHHDKAYRWAERRRIERHPTTGAMQLVEVRERVEELPAAAPSPAAAPGLKLFAGLRKLELMSFGVPEDWVEDVRAATEASLFELLPHLPQEAQEALLRLAVGEKPEAPKPAPAETDPFAHPDAQRRFRVLQDVEELRRALDFPWDRWAVFLHPAQRELVERRYSGPARVTGSAGTGKTIVALHRAAHLARRNPQARVLLTTFSKPLAKALAMRLASLVEGEAGITGRIEAQSLTGAAYELYGKLFGQPNIASGGVVQGLLRKAAAKAEGAKFPLPFLVNEWTEVVDAQQLMSWDTYREALRLGRKTRLGEKQRRALWSVFEEVQAGLRAQKLVTWAQVFGRLANLAGSGKALGYDFVVVDEAQDLSMAEARFLAAMAGGKPDGLFFTGDLGQRIFQQPFSWKAMGIDVRGRSHGLKINYRTSHQIRTQADRLLPGMVSDVDGTRESRRGTVSLFDGPAPVIGLFQDEADEAAAVGTWIAERLREGCAPEEVGILVRSQGEVARALAAVKAAGAKGTEFDEKVEVVPGAVSISQMHLAKGLEFRAVAVMACDDEVLPLQERVESVTDEADLEEVYETERHLLYVACTRARDNLWVSGVGPGSEFLRDVTG